MPPFAQGYRFDERFAFIAAEAHADRPHTFDVHNVRRSGRLSAAKRGCTARTARMTHRAVNRAALRAVAERGFRNAALWRDVQLAPAAIQSYKICSSCSVIVRPLGGIGARLHGLVPSMHSAPSASPAALM